MEIKIPFNINQATPTLSGNKFLATGNKINKTKRIEFLKSSYQTLNRNYNSTPNSTLFCIDANSGQIKFNFSLKKERYFGVWGYDNKNNVVIVSYDKNKEETNLLKLSIDSGIELEKTNIGQGIVNSIIYNNGKWFISGIINKKNVIYRLNNKLKIELIEDSDILNETVFLYGNIHGYIYMTCDNILYLIDQELNIEDSISLNESISDAYLGSAKLKNSLSSSYLYLVLSNNKLTKIKYNFNKWITKKIIDIDSELIDICFKKNNYEEIIILTENGITIFNSNLEKKNIIRNLKNVFRPAIEVSNKGTFLIYNQTSNLFVLEKNLLNLKTLEIPLSNQLGSSANIYIPNFDLNSKLENDKKIYNNQFLKTGNAPITKRFYNFKTKNSTNVEREVSINIKPTTNINNQELNLKKKDYSKKKKKKKKKSECNSCNLNKKKNYYAPIYVSIILLTAGLYLQQVAKINNMNIAWAIILVIIILLFVFR